MYRVTCKQCGAIGTAMDGNNPQAAVSCDCCTQDHDHDVSANSCRGANKPHRKQHPGRACAHPMGGIGCNVITPIGVDCPGGHCFPGVKGCTVCRPLSIEFEGSVELGPSAEWVR